MGGRREPRHIFHNTENWHVHLVAAEHAHTLACIGKSHFLRCGHHYSTGDGERLHQGEVNVARARRHVDDEVVELAPVSFTDELFQRVACHSAAPKHGFFLLHEEAY